MSAYYDWESFEHIYLEDSYVLNVEEADRTLCFTIEAVLTEEHPQYTPPITGEQYCYKNAIIAFRDITEIVWLTKNTHIYFTDANGEKDYGNIDHFSFSDGKYLLNGDWGEVLVSSTAPALIILE